MTQKYNYLVPQNIILVGDKLAFFVCVCLFFALIENIVICSVTFMFVCFFKFSGNGCHNENELK